MVDNLTIWPIWYGPYHMRALNGSFFLFNFYFLQLQFFLRHLVLLLLFLELLKNFSENSFVFISTEPKFLAKMLESKTVKVIDNLFWIKNTAKIPQKNTNFCLKYNYCEFKAIHINDSFQIFGFHQHIKMDVDT